MRRLAKEIRAGGHDAIAEDGRWLIGVPAIVADNKDPERQHRVRVIIPSIDEDLIFDEWARQLVFCLGDRFGTAFIPPKGSEVVLFGQLGQKFNFFYASVYNEEMAVADGYNDEMTVGARVPGNLKFRAEQVGRLDADQIEVHADQDVAIDGQNIESTATGVNKLAGQTVQVNGTTIQVSSNGSISITGGSVAINGTSVTLRGRPVNPTGPPI
jgi:phage gp45-like